MALTEPLKHFYFLFLPKTNTIDFFFVRSDHNIENIRETSNRPFLKKYYVNTYNQSLITQLTQASTRIKSAFPIAVALINLYRFSVSLSRLSLSFNDIDFRLFLIKHCKLIVQIETVSVDLFLADSAFRPIKILVFMIIVVNMLRQERWEPSLY